MDWTPSRVIALAIAAFAAGMVNSIAGGGSLLTFPVLLAAGVDPLVANATNTVALVPGSLGAALTYRAHLRGQSRAIAVMAVPSLIGGVLGALLLVRTGSALFQRLAPWLVLGATALFASNEALARRRERASQSQEESSTNSADHTLGTGRSMLALALAQLAVATYGGYFGAGIGIAMLAALSVAGMREIHAMNALKNVSAAVINGVAVVVFVRAGAADLRTAGFMAVAALLGGRFGAKLAQRVKPAAVRRTVTLVGLSIALYLFAHQILGVR